MEHSVNWKWTWPLMAIVVACGDAAPPGHSDGVPCRIELDSVVTLGPGSGAFGPTLGSRAARLPDGRFLTGEGYTRGVVTVFDVDGSFAGTFGSLGEGPGEFQRASEFRVAGDKVLVNDQTLRRVSEFSFDGTFLGVASSSLGTGRFAPLDDGVVLLALESRGRDHRNFGKVSGRLVDGEFDVQSEVFASGPWYMLSAGDGTFWISAVSRYLLERWTDDGRRLSRIERDLDWFPEPSLLAADPEAERVPFMGRISAVMRGPDRTLNVLLFQVDRAAALATRLQPGQEEAGASHIDPETVVSIANSVIHVLSEADGRLLADTVVTDREIAGFADASHVYARRSGTDGAPVLDVFRITLSNQTTGDECK